MFNGLSEKLQARKAVFKQSYMRDHEYQRIYKKACKDPVKEDKIVFVELRQSRISNSFRLMFNELANKYDFDIHCHFLLGNSRNRNVFYDRAREMVEDIATARYVFMNEGSDVIGSLDVRPETDIIQLWHGCGAFKKFGLSTGELIFGRSTEDQLKHPDNKNYSLVTVSSPEVEWAYEEAMNIKPEENIVRATGVSRTDVYFDEVFIERAKERFFKAVPQARGKKVILYAPTFRGRVRHAKTPDMLNIQMFKEELGDDYFLLFKHHPNVRKPRVIPPEHLDFAAEVSALDIEDLTCAADICITDYSSLAFEYSLLDKPIIFFAYDLDTYYDWRGFYFDYYEMSPGPVFTTNAEIIDYIKNVDERFDRERMNAFRERFMRSCDGHSTERILLDTMGQKYLDAHRKECAESLPLHVIPSSKERFSVQQKRLAGMAAEAAQYAALASRATDVKAGSVVLLDCDKPLRTLMKKHVDGAKLVKSKDLLKSGKGAEALMSAEYIFIDRDVKALDAIALNEGQKVVYVPKNGVPVERFGQDSLAHRGGLDKAEAAAFPPFKQVDYVACAAEDADIFLRATGVGSAGIVPVGNVLAEYYADDAARAAARKKLSKLFPKVEGKKVVIDFIKREANRAPIEENVRDQYLYETLGEGVVFVKLFELVGVKPADLKYSDCMNSYTKAFVDATGKLSVSEALVLADAIIGADAQRILEGVAAGKPSFAYELPEGASADLRLVNYDVTERLPGGVMSNPKQLAEQVKAALGTEAQETAMQSNLAQLLHAIGL